MRVKGRQACSNELWNRSIPLSYRFYQFEHLTRQVGRCKRSYKVRWVPIRGYIGVIGNSNIENVSSVSLKDKDYSRDSLVNYGYVQEGTWLVPLYVFEMTVTATSMFISSSWVSLYTYTHSR